MKQLELYKEDLRIETERIGTEIRQLKTDANTSAIDRARFVQYLDELEQRWKALRQQLDSSADASWERGRRDFRRALADARDRLAIAKRAARARMH